MPEPWFASTIDGMTPVGAPVISSSASSLAVTAVRGVELSGGTSGAGAQSPVLPERLTGSAGFAVKRFASTTSRVLCELRSPTGEGRIRIAHNGPSASIDETLFQYWDGSTWVTIGAAFALGTDVNQVRIEWSGYGTSSGAVSVRIFKDAGESLVATRSASGLNFSSLSGIAQMYVGTNTATTTSGIIFSAMFVADDLGDSSYVYNAVANADGADTGGTGGFGSVNDSSGSNYDTTFISLNTAGLRRSLKNTANRNYDGRTIRAVAVNVRLRRGATGPTRARIYLTIGGTRYYHPTTQLLTTSFESYTFVFENDPSTSLPWELTNAQAASLEWGVEAVA